VKYKKQYIMLYKIILLRFTGFSSSDLCKTLYHITEKSSKNKQYNQHTLDFFLKFAQGIGFRPGEK
jgi:hypothetical protein